MNTHELQQMIIDRCHKTGACTTEFKALKQVINNPIHFARVLLSNHGWCIEKGIYSASELLMFEPEILHKAGLALPQYTPVDFERTASIGDLDWMPLNEGATTDSLYGDLTDFDKAVATKFDARRMASKIEWQLLAAAPNQFGVYGDTFGRVFRGEDNNLFLPASGRRNHSDGSLEYEGNRGNYWASTVNNADLGFKCYFYNGYINPEYSDVRSVGFSVRCVQE